MKNYLEEFKKAEDVAKKNGQRQALLAGLLEVAIIGMTLFNSFPLLIKLFIFLVPQFILGLVMSSDWMQQKREIMPNRKKP